MQDQSVLNSDFIYPSPTSPLRPDRPFPSTPEWYRIAVETMIRRAEYTYRDGPVHPIDVDIVFQPGSRLFASIYGFDGAPVIMRLLEWRFLSPVLVDTVEQVARELEHLPGLVEERLTDLLDGLAGDLPSAACVWSWYHGIGIDPNPIGIDREDLEKIRALLAWAGEHIASSSLAPLLDEPDLLHDQTPDLISSVDEALEWHKHYSPYWLAEARMRAAAAYNRLHPGKTVSVDELSGCTDADHIDPDQARRDWFAYLAQQEDKHRRARTDQ